MGCVKTGGCCQTKDGRPPCIIHTCCGCPLLVPVIIIWILDFLFCLVMFVLLATLAFGFLDKNRGQRYTLGAIMLQFLVQTVISGFMMYGAMKEKRWLLWGWIWARGIELLTDVSKFVLLRPILHNHLGSVWLYFLVPMGAYVVAIFVVSSYAIQLKAKERLSSTSVRFIPGEGEVQT